MKPHVPQTSWKLVQCTIHTTHGLFKKCHMLDIDRQNSVVSYVRSCPGFQGAQSTGLSAGLQYMGCLNNALYLILCGASQERKTKWHPV